MKGQIIAWNRYSKLIVDSYNWWLIRYYNWQHNPNFYYVHVGLWMPELNSYYHYTSDGVEVIKGEKTLPTLLRMGAEIVADVNVNQYRLYNTIEELDYLNKGISEQDAKAWLAGNECYLCQHFIEEVIDEIVDTESCDVFVNSLRVS